MQIGCFLPEVPSGKHVLLTILQGRNLGSLLGAGCVAVNHSALQASVERVILHAECRNVMVH